MSDTSSGVKSTTFTSETWWSRGINFYPVLYVTVNVLSYTQLHSFFSIRLCVDFGTPTKTSPTTTSLVGRRERTVLW